MRIRIAFRSEIFQRRKNCQKKAAILVRWTFMSVAFASQLRPWRNCCTAQNIRCLYVVWSSLGHECPSYMNHKVAIPVGWTFMSVALANPLRPWRNCCTSKNIRFVDVVWSNLGHECPSYDYSPTNGHGFRAGSMMVSSFQRPSICTNSTSSGGKSLGVTHVHVAVCASG